MTISYRLEIATTFPAVDVANRLLELAGLDGALDLSAETHELLEGKGVKLGTWLRIMDTRPEPFNPVVEDLGVNPTVSVSFRLGKEYAAHLQQDNMIRMVSELLSELAGDAVLHLHFERIWLLRRGGELTLSDDDAVWTPLRLSMVPPPYHRAALVFAE